MKEIKLGDVELELMNILWEISEGSVHDVQKKMKEPRAYTSVSTMLRLLEKKGYVGSRKQSKSHYYFPKLKQEVFQKSSVKSLVRNVFDSAPTSLVSTLLKTEDVNLEELSQLIENLKSKSKP